MRNNLKDFWIGITALIMVVIFMAAGVSAIILMHNYSTALLIVLCALVLMLAGGVWLLWYLTMKL